MKPIRAWAVIDDTRVTTLQTFSIFTTRRVAVKIAKWGRRRVIRVEIREIRSVKKGKKR